MPSWSTAPPTGRTTPTTSDLDAEVEGSGDPVGTVTGSGPDTHPAGAPEDPSPGTPVDHAPLPGLLHAPASTTHRRRVLKGSHHPRTRAALSVRAPDGQGRQADGRHPILRRADDAAGIRWLHARHQVREAPVPAGSPQLWLTTVVPISDQS